MGRRNDDATAGTWSIVLAGGRGERLRRLTERWLGQHVPKQFCAFVGERSMLQHTIDRARRISTPGRVVTVVAAEHRSWSSHQIARELSPGVVHQPEDRDTAAGVFLPLTHVRAEDPDAKVVILPADHFVHPEERFIDIVRDAVRSVDDFPDKLLLLGVRPDSNQLDYGWIVPGERISTPRRRAVQSVRAFVEKPSMPVAAAARVRGGLWNTLIMAVRAQTLWKLGERYVPRVVRHFEGWMDGPRDAATLRAMYRTMPRHNFSSELLQRAHEHVALMELDGVLWSDWGREDRITETLELIGMHPAWARPERAVRISDRTGRVGVAAVPI